MIGNETSAKDTAALGGQAPDAGPAERSQRLNRGRHA
jgi:hypothetical protein